MGAVQEEYKVDYIMETVGLRKSYKGNVVVNDVNIHVPKGAIYGFVGPNGAGKSTVMKMILNLIQPEAGEVQLFGEKVTDQSYEVFKRVGSIIENPYFYEKMTARQNLELHCDYMGFPNKERIDEVLQMVDLQNVEGKQIRHYSLGMKQRLAIARAVVVCTVLSLWPFIIGMIRKSVPATIVTSLVVIVFRQLIISKNITYQESLLQILLVAFITFGVALFAFKKKVPKLY